MRDGKGGYRRTAHCNNCGVEMSLLAPYGRNFLDDETRDAIFKNGWVGRIGHGEVPHHRS